MNSTAGRDRWLHQSEGPREATANIPSASAAYKHISAKDGYPTLDVSTLHENFTQSVEKYSLNKCLGLREKQADGTVGPFVWKTYKEVGDEVALLASGLKTVNAAAKGRIGVFGANCPEWMMAMQVSLCQSIVAMQILILWSKNHVKTGSGLTPGVRYPTTYV